MKHRIRLIFTSVLAIAALYGVYQYLHRPPIVQIPALTHPVIENDKHRLKLIADIWDSIDKELKDPATAYLSDTRLTDTGRAFIKKSVPVLMAKEVGTEALKADPDIQLLEKLLIESIIASYSFLKWCPCIFPAKRIDLAFMVVRDVKRQFPDRATHLTYVSLGSGDLLQDFVGIAALINQGYCTIDMIGIDFKYQYIRHTTIEANSEVATQKRAKEGTNTSDEAKKIAQMIEAFRSSIAQLLEKRPHIGCDVTIEPYINAYAYIDAVKAGSEDKADILVMADPTRVLEYLNVNTLEEANCLKFSDNGLVLCMSEYQKPKSYFPVDSSKRFLQEDIAHIQEIVNAVPDNEYRTHLKSALATYAQNANRTLTYHADPYITFQDLIRHTAKPTTLAYGLFEIPGIPESVVHRLDVATYINKDVISPHIGRDLTTAVHRTTHYKEIPL